MMARCVQWEADTAMVAPLRPKLVRVKALSQAVSTWTQDEVDRDLACELVQVAVFICSKYKNIDNAAGRKAEKCAREACRTVRAMRRRCCTRPQCAELVQ